MQYNIKRMPFAFNGQPMQIDVLEKEDGQVFFEATKIWDMSGKPNQLDIETYININQVKELMLYNYLKDNNIHNLGLVRERLENIQENRNLAIKGLTMPLDVAPLDASPILDVSTVELKQDTIEASTQSKQDHLNAIRMYISNGLNSKLPVEIEDFFIVRHSNGVFFEKNLFLDYAMSLSTGLRSHMIGVFQKYGWLEGLMGDDKIEGLLSLISEIELDKISK
jgi:hypothetical protein